MMVVCGNSMEDLRNGVEAMEQAMRSGAVMGVGGSSLADIKSGMAMMEQMMGGCSCCEDEDDEIFEAIEEVLDTFYGHRLQ